MKQTRPCDPAGVHCDNLWIESTSDEDHLYVADIDRYTLLIDHSITARGTRGRQISGSMLDYQGFLEQCNATSDKCTTEKIRCIGAHCDKKDEVRLASSNMRSSKRVLSSNADWGSADIGEHVREALSQRRMSDPSMGYTIPVSGTASEASLNTKGGEGVDLSDDLIQINAGDVISVKRLLEVAGVDLDRSVNHAGESRRYEGLLLRLTIRYSNVRPLMSLFHSPVQYTYSVSVEAAPGFKTVRTFKEERDDERELYNTHGIFIKIDQDGHIAWFSLTGLLLIVTTSQTLLGMALFCTDWVATNVLKHRKEYSAAKTDHTKDFSSEDKEMRYTSVYPYAYIMRV